MKLTPEKFKHIPPFFLHQVMMGSGCLYTKGKEIVLTLPCYDNRLRCGCSGSKAYKFTNKEGKTIFESVHKEEYEDFDYHLGPFQGKEWDLFWESYYIENPNERPIKVNNKC